MKDKGVMKICAVCGDIAIARNFGALTCKSCKPFFRRNAVKNKSFKCKNDSKCDINLKTRKKCRKCRLDKCFAVGMKKELILNDVEKHFRRSLVEENRKRKQRDNHKLTTNSESPSKSSLSSETNESINSSDELNDFSNEMTFSDQMVHTIDANEDHMSDHIQDFLRITEVIQTSSDPYKTTLEISDHLPIARPFNNFEKGFNQLEDYKLMELFQVLRPIVMPSNKNMKLIICKDVSDMVTIGNLFYEREIKNLIKAIKNMNVFENICENDRIALVKYSCIDILCLRSSNLYDFSKESWIISIDKEYSIAAKLDLLKALKSDIYIIYKNYMNDIIKECESDYVIFDLLTAIALFNPNRPNLINKDIVKVQQHVYLYLLQRYLHFKCQTKCESEYKFARLMNTLISAHILGELEKKYFIEDYPEEYCPLVKEVFDIKYFNSIKFNV